MPMLCPSIPIDKNKKGGRNYDSSKLTDFKKICLISNDDTTKPNQQTDRIELRRGAILASTLLTIPGFVVTAPPTDFLGEPCTQGVSFSGQTTFWIMYGNGGGGTLYTYSGNKLSSPSPTNSHFVANNGYAKALVNISSNLADNPNNRTGILKAINDKFAETTGVGKTVVLPLTASFTGDGKLIISTPSNISAGYFLGLYFGTPANGSVDLGVFLEDGGSAGVSHAALLITGGNRSVTANYPITC